MRSGALSRRVLLGAMATAALAPPGPADAGSVPRIVALDWAQVAALLSIGVAPAGVAEAQNYRTWVREPAIPPGIPDVGLRTGPNLEAILSIRPDLILINPLSGDLEAQLRRIAPVEVTPLSDGVTPPLDLAETRLVHFGALSGRQAVAERYVRDFRQDLAAMRGRLHVTRPLLLMSFLDSRHIRIFGRDSLFGNVLTRLGLGNAWQGEVNGWGFVLAGIEVLASHADALVVIIGPVPEDARRSFTADGLWAHLPAARPGNSVILPPSWAFGDVSAAWRFGRLIEAHLPGGAG